MLLVFCCKSRYYLSTILDDYSRYIVSYELCKTMKAYDVKNTLDLALIKTGLTIDQRPKLLSDNGSCYISGELQYLEQENILHLRGAPMHPQTQGKIERYHRSLKNVIKLDHYFLPQDLEYQIIGFVDHYNNHRYHESINNLTPADVFYGRGERILEQRRKIKLNTMKKRRKQYQKQLILNN